ncbi:MAG TPA: 4Fe-4S dicluster domain-containing protein [Prolixibacteraceae bacterium]|nr:4Fe-4S dicluster domain-containing protein [Prolixibacteraceae bacterium]
MGVKSLSRSITWKLARRIVLSLFFLMTCLSVWYILPRQLSAQILNIQLGPAIIRLTTGLAGWTIAGIITLVVIVVGFGRIYCSTICPLGFLQDISIWLGKILGIKRDYEIEKIKRLKILRISILATTVLLLIAGSAFATGLLEPFSIFSRFMFFLKILVNGPVSGSVLPMTFIAFTILAIVLPAIKQGRFFCSWICPVGTMLWVFSKFSLFKFRIDQSACNHCNKCLVNCKAGAISMQTKLIDQALCVGCFNCLSVCNQQAVKIIPQRSKNKRDRIDAVNEVKIVGIKENRRRFLRQFSSALFVMCIPLSVISSNEWQWIQSGKVKLLPVFPLGAMNLERFKTKCTGCMLCAQKCPSKIIIPSIGSIDGSPILPVLYFKDNYCLEDCVACSQVCPTGALQEVRVEEKNTTKMASLRLDLTACQIVAEGLECAICAEICPLHAIEMKRNSDQKYPIPVIIQNLCNGCGKCQFRCPVKQSENIFLFTS